MTVVIVGFEVLIGLLYVNFKVVVKYSQVLFVIYFIYLELTFFHATEECSWRYFNLE